MKGRKKTTEEFIGEAIIKHGDRYDYSLVEYVGSDEYVEIICKKHGVFEQRPKNHLDSNGCKKCGNETIGKKLKSTTKVFIEESTKVHKGKYDYSKLVYTKCNDPVTIICPNHGEFERTPKSHREGFGCKDCSVEERLDRIRIKQAKLFLKKATKTHNNFYNYSKVEYIKGTENVIVICPIHGDFPQAPRTHLNGAGCMDCGNERVSKALSKIPEHFKDLVGRIRSSIGSSFCRKNYNKNTKTAEILGCTWEEFKTHLEDNPYGFTIEDKDLDLDHIIPISSAQTEEDVYRLNHYTNFQLLPKDYNRHVKRAKEFDEECLEGWLENNTI